MSTPIPHAERPGWTWDALRPYEKGGWPCGRPGCNADESVVALVSQDPYWRYGLCVACANDAGCPAELLPIADGGGLPVTEPPPLPNASIRPGPVLH
ncbi:hypothetical protein Ppa06_57340 [Planomonospora parontospora subsp. parontospora]|uniref:Uncharacterized protein n=2 Tax=Planomonospora parontospora TaxID=58119 RepID=A0AA37F7L4_9ACTN|nr:hypothetical protein [Planomonospora parontospora]GGK90912.1 hypothetical protein GCM10010126_57960 [Planomonospora parontospora]GII11936.1 hypothetical protein Ppa06_57340 [Planomonospora parontospora subsp. parontospora]